MNESADTKVSPMLLEPQFHARIWGGRKLEDVLGVDLPPGEIIGESWSMGSDNRVLNGPMQGNTLQEVVASDPARMLGTLVVAGGRADLPLLFKILDCEDWLSIQVHPTDEQAEALEGQHYGKTESWYIIAAEPGARIIHGLSEPLDPQRLGQAVADNTIAEHLRYLDLETGDTVHTPAGLVHALGGGLLLAEIQENSDITYRLYDWDRRDPQGQPRQLHVEKSLAVTHYEPPDFSKNTALRVMIGASMVSYLVACRYFAYQLLVPSGTIAATTNRRSFHGLYCVAGTAALSWAGGELPLRPGQTVFVPAAVGAYSVAGTGAQLLRWFVPDLRADVVEPLLAANYSREQIAALGGGTRDNDLADSALWS